MLKIDKRYGRLELQYVSEANGAWEHGNRGRIRVVFSHHLAEPAINVVLPHDKVLFESGTVCLDYPGGVWGYGSAEREAVEIFKKYSLVKNMKALALGNITDI